MKWPSDNSASAKWPIYTRGNVGEVYPDVVLPLEWEVGGQAAEAGWRTGAETVGFLTSKDYGPGEKVVIGVFGGYAYFNASLMRLLGVRTPGLAMDVIDTQFLGDADVPAYKRQSGDRNLMASFRMVRTAIKTLTAKSVPLVEEMTQRAEAMREAAPSMDAPDSELWNHIRHTFGDTYDYFISSHVIVTMQATIAAGQLTDFCEKKLGDPNLAVSFTTGIGDVISAQPARELWQLANETAEEDFDAALARFMERHGHRGPNEFSLAGRDWAAYPDLVHAAIKTMKAAGPERSPETQDRRVAAEREAALAAAEAKLGRGAKRLNRAIANTALWSRAREQSKNQVIRATQPVRHAYLELVRRSAERGGVSDPIGPMLLNEAEFLAYLDDPPSVLPVIEKRRADLEQLQALEPPFAFDTSALGGKPPPVSTWTPRRTTGAAVAAGSTVSGAAGAPGTARGIARVITDPSDPFALEPGDIMIAPLTDPAWTPLFMAAGGVVVEIGAAMSHSMIVSREMGIPCVVGVADATLIIPDGAEVEIDGQAGTVRIL